MSKWTDFVKQYATKNNKSYGCALSDPNCSKEYHEKYNKKNLAPKTLQEVLKIRAKIAEDSKKSIKKQKQEIKELSLWKGKPDPKFMKMLDKKIEEKNKNTPQSTLGPLIGIKKKKSAILL
jgi:hypothetical protein